MQQIIQYLRAISAAQFAGIVILFFMPFVEVSCGNMFTIEISGKQFATGGEISVPQMPTASPAATPNVTPGIPSAAPGQTQDKNIDQKMSALLAWIAAVAGVVVSLIAGRNFRIASAALGGLGVVTMFWLKSDIDKDFSVQLTQAQGILRLDYKFAFWACVILFVTAAATNVYALMRPPDKPAQS
jgi:hypothetical protein